MWQVVDSHLITGGPLGLKLVAPLAGFTWDVDDPGGAGSMLRYDEAVGAEAPEERERAQEWLLEYNRGDVEATLAIRDWIETASIPSVASPDVIPAGLARSVLKSTSGDVEVYGQGGSREN